ncbi:acid phosphatase type 7-like [Biomphalaria glabrata]|uniref:Acid phosphatase type 7-like n=1 Tax=Biomphalaria glabrata TaxID=6526 RepID=A0A9W3AWK0_BIOGL|nr:acid phosphatase type 7-like [Biomphalaria glabrata]XP_055891597.1 acid phosphatase type 7-like [Biomphalaria glabrata]
MRLSFLSLTLTLVVIFTSADKLVDECTPRQVHISYGKLTTEFVIVWSTVGQCTAVVHYGTGPWSLNQQETGKSVQFNENISGLKWLHRVLLQQLEFGTTYFYSPNSDRSSAASRFFFKTSPSNSSLPVELLVVSELNSSSSARTFMIDEAQKGKLSAILHTGNIALNLSSENGTVGDEYLKRIEPAVAVVPYLVSPGPNEVEEETFTHYLHRFSMPDTEWPMSIDKMWYSLDLGPVHLISFSSEVFYLKDNKYATAQHNWLIKDLEAAGKNRQNVPWLIAFGNRPFYCTYENPRLDCNQKKSNIKTGLEDIFFHYGVDLVIQSYGGAYERTYPMLKNVATATNYSNPNGPVYIISGSANHYDLEYNFTDPAPNWSAFRFVNESVLTVGRLRVVNASVLEYEQVNVQDSSVIDTFVIQQEHHGQFSMQDLSSNIVAEVDKNIVDAGGKPGHLNIDELKAPKSPVEALLEGDTKLRIIIGGSCAGVAVILVSMFIFAKKCKRKSKSTRRWEQMDINYGKKFYTKAPEKDEDNDFEIDMSEGTEPTRKLLNADN